MTHSKYNFTDYDLRYKRALEKERGAKISNEQFYKYILKLRKWMKEYIKVVKKWVEEKPWEAEQLKRLVDGWEERERNKELYDKVAKIKKLTIVELEKLLIPILEKESYIHFQPANPEVNKDIILPFTVQDSKAGRKSRASEYDLRRILRKTLENTNWRLMTDGINHRLGILSGRLRGYELEEDLLKLTR